jgi:hypothetical protein
VLPIAQPRHTTFHRRRSCKPEHPDRSADAVTTPVLQAAASASGSSAAGFEHRQSTKGPDQLPSTFGARRWVLFTPFFTWVQSVPAVGRLPAGHDSTHVWKASLARSTGASTITAPKAQPSSAPTRRPRSRQRWLNSRGLTSRPLRKPPSPRRRPTVRQPGRHAATSGTASCWQSRSTRRGGERFRRTVINRRDIMKDIKVYVITTPRGKALVRTTLRGPDNGKPPVLYPKSTPSSTRASRMRSTRGRAAAGAREGKAVRPGSAHGRKRLAPGEVGPLAAGSPGTASRCNDLCGAMG